MLAAVGIVAYVAGSWEENPIAPKPWGPPPPPSRDAIRDASRLLGQADAALASTSATRVADAEKFVLQAQTLDPDPEVLAAKDVVENMKRPSHLSVCGCMDWTKQNHPHLLGAQQLSSCSPGSDVMQDFTTLAKEMQRVQDVCCPADQVGKTCDVTNLACNDPACESAVVGFSQACYAQDAILNEGSPNADNTLFDGAKNVLAAASKACGGRERTHEYYINDPTLSMSDPATGRQLETYEPITGCAGTLNDASFSADRFMCEQVKIQAPRNHVVELKVKYAHLVDQNIEAYDNPGCYAGGPKSPHGGPHGGCLTPKGLVHPQVIGDMAVGKTLRSKEEELIVKLPGCWPGAGCRESPALFSLEISCHCLDNTGCGGHGTCDIASGQCACNDGFYGQNCTKTQVPEPEPDPWRPTVDPPIHPPPSPPEPAPSPPPEPAPPLVQCPVTPGAGIVGEGYFGWQPAPGHVGDYAECCESECTYEWRGGQPFAHGKPFSCTKQQAEHSDSCVGKGNEWEFVAHSLGHDDKADPWRCCRRF